MTPRIHALWPTWALGLALSATFLGERVLAGDASTRTALAALAAALVLAAVGARGRELGAAGEAKRPVARLLLGTTAGVALALALYALIPLAFAEESAKTPRAILWALAPIVLVVSAAPLVAMEVASASGAFLGRYELARVRNAFARGLALALMLSSLFLANFLANRHEAKWDLSFGQKTVASEQTLKAVRDLTVPVKVRLFFPRANEVAEALDPYFDSLKRANPNLSIEALDHALATAAAKETGVSENGYVAVSWEKGHEKIRVGEKMSSARSALRKFDSSFVSALLKVTRQKRTVYFTTGHGERSASPDSKDARAPTKLLKQLLETNQFTLKPLGIAEGSSDRLPEDASMVFILGPERPFSGSELAALNAAADKGARILLALEAEREGDPLAGFLAPLGLSFDKTTLANERTNVPLTRTEADRAVIWSNRYSSHESVTTMTRNQKLATVLARTGSLTKAEKAPERTKVDMVLTAVDDTFADVNGDLSFDKDTEKKLPFGLAAAVTRTSTTGKKSDEARIFVLADADVLSDELIKFEGNYNLLGDIIYWLRAADEPVVPTTSAEDVQIVHKKEEDTLWFYSTTLGVPALVLAAGFFVTKRRRRT